MAEALRIETVPNARDKTSPSGGSGTVIYAGRIEDRDPNPEVRGQNWYGDGNSLGVSGEMVRDPHVKRSVEAIVDPLLAAYWDFEPASRAPVEIEAGRYAAWDFFECNNWERTVRLGTNGVVRDGVVMFEATDRSGIRVPVERFPNHPGKGMGVGYTKFHHRAASTVDSWIQSKNDPENADGFEQLLFGSDVEAPGIRRIALSAGDLFFRLTWDQEGADFDGNAPLRAAYGAYKCKRLLLTLAMIRHEREGIGIPEMSEPDREVTTDEKDEAKSILRSLRGHEEAYIYLPNGWEFKWRTTSGQSTGLYEAIEQCNRDIAYNLGVAWMLLGIAGKTGSWALATEQRGHYVLSLEKYARFWEAAINHGMDGWSPVERLIRRNYGPDVGVPRLVARNMPTRDWLKLLPLLPALKKAGLLKGDDALRAFLRTVTTLPAEDPETADELDTMSEGEIVGAMGDALETPVDEDDADVREEQARHAAQIAQLERTIEASQRQSERAMQMAEELFNKEALARRAASGRKKEPAPA